MLLNYGLSKYGKIDFTAKFRGVDPNVGIKYCTFLWFHFEALDINFICAKYSDLFKSPSVSKQLSNLMFFRPPAALLYWHKTCRFKSNVKFFFAGTLQPPPIDLFKSACMNNSLIFTIKMLIWSCYFSKRCDFKMRT